MTAVLALDIGSSSVRAQRFDERAEPAGALRQEHYASSDPVEVARLARSVLGGEEPDGTSCFAHSLVAVDASWRPLTPILGWRDTRSAGAADWLRRRLDDDEVHARTGAYLHPSFWSAKLAWLAQEQPEAFRRAAHFVSFSDFLRGVPETSLSMASSSGLLDLTARGWDEELLSTLGVEPERLPRIVDQPVWLDAACSNLGAGCVGRERGADSRHLGRAADPLRERASTTAARPLPLPARRASRRRGRRALRRRQPLRLARAHAPAKRGIAQRPAAGRARPHLPALSRRGALDGLEPRREGCDHRADVRDDASRPAPGGARGGRLPLRRDRRPAARRARGRRHRRWAPALGRVDPADGRRARPAGARVRGRRGVPARRRGFGLATNGRRTR